MRLTGRGRRRTPLALRRDMFLCRHPWAWPPFWGYSRRYAAHLGSTSRRLAQHMEGPR